MKEVVKEYGNLSRHDTFDCTSEKPLISEVLSRKDIEDGSPDVKEMAAEWFASLSQKLKNQDELIKGLLGTSNSNMMSKEVANLDKIYQQMVANAETLTQSLPQEEAAKIADQMNETDICLMKTKRSVAKWMSAQFQKDERSTLTDVSRKSAKSKSSLGRSSRVKRDSGIDNETLMMEHIKRLQERLEGQRGLIKDLFNANDVEMLTREIDVLEQIHGNLVAAVDKIVKMGVVGSKSGLQEVMMEEDAKLFRLKKDVIQWMAVQTDADARSQVSCSSRGTVMSGNSVSSRGKVTKSDLDPQVKNELWDQLLKRRMQLNIKKNRCNELVKTKDIVTLRKEIYHMDEMFKEASEIALGLRELLPGKEVEKIMDKVEAEDVEIHQIKRAMVRLMAAECTATNRAIKNARKEENEDLSVYQDKEIVQGKEESLNNQRREPFNTPMCDERLKEGLENELRRIGTRLENQLSLVSDLLKSNDTVMVNREVQNLDRVYDDYVVAASQLRALSLQEEAEAVSALIDGEDANVFHVKQMVAKWLVSHADATVSQEAAANSGHINESVGQREGVKERKLRTVNDKPKKVGFGCLDEDCRETCSQFADQTDLMNKHSDTKIDKLIAEVDALKKDIRTERGTAADDFKERRKNEKVSGVETPWDGTVLCASEKIEEVEVCTSQEKEIAELRAEITAMRRDKHLVQERSARTLETEGCKDKLTSWNTEIADLRAEIAAIKRDRQAKLELVDRVEDVEGKEGDRSKIKVVKIVEAPNPREKTSDEKAAEKQLNAKEDATTRSLVKLNELMVQTLKLQSAPKPEIDTFSGDPLDYNYFFENFKDVVESMIDDPRQRLVRLLKSTQGEAKELIKHCVHEEPETCYSTAVSLLEKEYGSPFRIAAAYLEKIKGWPQIRNNDPGGLRELYRFLVRCASIQKRGIIDLDSPLTIRTIQLALPSCLQDKWTGRVAKIRKRKNIEATFADFVEYVEEESNVLSDPVYAKSGGKDKNKLDVNLKTCLTGVEEPKVMCQHCKGEHDLDECPDFIGKSARDKKDLLFRLKVCFSCYGKGHHAKACITKRTCGTCGGTHPTGLHDVTFKVSVVYQNYQNGDEGAMCIVPVRLSRKDSPQEEMEVYAMLDECSTGTFIIEELTEEWIGRRETAISVKTVTGTKEMDVYAIEDLRVRAVKEFQDRYGSPQIQLPTTYTQKTLPMDKGDIPNVERIAKWDYLKELLTVIPKIKDIPLGLLIGRNCKKALEPVQLISSREDGPYAKRSRLGWCIVGSDEEQVRMSCNSIKVCCSSKDLTYASPRIPHVVLNTKITDIAIAEALKEMYKTDFVERDGERNGLSKEDRAFLDMMKNNVNLSNGHYELPLPLRVEEIPSSRAEDMEEESCPIAANSGLSVTMLSPEKLKRNKTNDRDQERSGRFKKKCVVMPKNRSVALQRLGSVKRKMLRDEDFRREYTTFMKKLFAAGHARKVPDKNIGEKAWFLPHHGVFHPMKRKIRVVFDCSAEMGGVSLNSKLMQGPDFTNSLIGVLIRFRKGLIPFTADIEAMYYQVRVPKEQWKYLRFFWWEGDDCTKEVVECEMMVHPFGAVSSKNCVTFALHQTAFDNEKLYGKEATETLLLDFYVDDWLKSLDEEKAVVSLINNTMKMCAQGGFNLTKLVCPNQRVMDSVPKEKRAPNLIENQINGPSKICDPICDKLPDETALGMQWQIADDTLGFKVSFLTDNGTRLGCLSTISKIHDPCGLLGPFLLKGRKILQKMTANSISWHQALPEQESNEWSQWRDEIALLNDMKIRRCYRSANMGAIVSTTLHCFSDASFVGYGVACYLRTVDDEGKVEVSLVLGKSRVSPLKPTTVPRLELTAASVSARLAAILVEELKIPGLETFYWVDNKIVLGYICNNRRRYRVYVANRVQLIDEYTQGQNWRYVTTRENPADYASRGISPKDVEKVQRHFIGPDFLRRPEENWRSANTEMEIDENDVEVKVEKQVNVVVISDGSVVEHFERRISCWHRMKRVLAWIQRFIINCKTIVRTRVKAITSCDVMVKLHPTDGPEKAIAVDDLTVEALELAERALIKMLQERDLSAEIRDLKENRCKKKKGDLWRLNPFVDEWGILRVGGRLVNAKEDKDFKFPVIIPKGTVCTRRLIEWHHRQIQHRGKHSTVSRLREYGFWVINSSKETGSVVFRCVRCRWLRGRCGEQKMANLPANRIAVEPPFTFCGVDVFGPWDVKSGRKTVKRYGVLFTCFSLRAIHIEVASSLETDTFIQALRRFIARRGAVRELRSDNGTNFLGADNELKKAILELDQEKISAFLSEEGCNWIGWKRNTPRASHMGGVWERQIRTVRNVLNSLIKSSPRTLDEETLTTFLVEAEAIVNSRPLTTENLHDPDSRPLSPNQILTMKSQLVLPPPGVFQERDMYCRKRWRITQHLANCFWSRWRKEYLQMLQSRSKWTDSKRNLKVDDVVLLKEEGVVRGHWPMGRVTEVHTSEDGLVRTVSVQVGKQRLKRPVTKTVLLLAANGNTSFDNTD